MGDNTFNHQTTFQYVVGHGDGVRKCARKECRRSYTAIPQSCAMLTCKSTTTEKYHCLRPVCVSKTTVNNMLGEGVTSAGAGPGSFGYRAGYGTADKIPGVSSLPDDQRQVAIELIEALSSTTSSKVYSDNPEYWDEKLKILDSSFTVEEMVSMMPKTFQKKLKIKADKDAARAKAAAEGDTESLKKKSKKGKNAQTDSEKLSEQFGDENITQPKAAQ
uniref:Uncharacterized protein n=2 Tax=Hemiselmis andersenii TaxID=464988 RepID=A0A6U2I1N1_HEMAN